MFTKHQKHLLKNFADFSDKLFDLGIITTDSFTGEIGEYVVCNHFKLKKSNRVTKAIDGVCEMGHNYQVKAKVVLNNNYNYNITRLDSTAFHFLTVVYFDTQYNPIKILRIPSEKIQDGKISITSKLITSGIEVIDKSEIKIPTKIKNAIKDFAEAYDELEINGIIRSRRIVGDIGELYACKQLKLKISPNKNEKGIDATDKMGLTYEIKTRRVYESNRRVSETRRLNNLFGKSADYLIVVVLDRNFICAGMWLIPMQNLTNPKSANLKIVNTTPGTKSLVPNQISWLQTGPFFSPLDLKNQSGTVLKKITTAAIEKKIKQTHKRDFKKPSPNRIFKNDNSNTFKLGVIEWLIIIFVILYFLNLLF